MFSERVAQFEARLMQLGFAVPDRAVEHGSNFIMLKTLDVVQDETAAVAGRQGGDGPLQRQPVDGAGKGQVGSAEAAAGSFFRSRLHRLIERNQRKALLAQL